METKRSGPTHGHMDGQNENSILSTNKVCRGYNKFNYTGARMLDSICKLLKCVLKRLQITPIQKCTKLNPVQNCTGFIFYTYFMVALL